jgi:hypothetical protein
MLLLPAACTRAKCHVRREPHTTTRSRYLRSFNIVENRHGLSLHRRRALAHVTRLLEESLCF